MPDSLPPAGTPDPGLAPDLALGARAGLPDALRVLLDQHPREAWEADPHFHGLVSMWLDRHLWFRKRLAALTADARSLLDRRLDPEAYGTRLSRLGGEFVGHLHGHHGIEDDHYFPALRVREPRIERGFDILDLDHQALDGQIDGFVEDANGLLRALPRPIEAGAAAGRLADRLAGFETFLDRHLTDEEDLIVPVILRAGGDV